MKKFVIAFMCAGSLLFLGACLPGQTRSGNAEVKAVTPKSVPAVSEAGSGEKTLAAAPAAVEKALTAADFQIDNKVFNARDGIKWYCYAAVPKLDLRPEAAKLYPGLAAGLERMNKKDLDEAGNFIENTSKNLAEVWAESKDSVPSYVRCNYLTSEYALIRSDAQAVCLQIFSEIYLGGAHGDHNVKFYKFDPRSGEPIRLGQLIGNLENAESFLVENLPKQHPDACLFDYPETIHGLFAKARESQDAADILEQHWSLTDSGLVFHFNPYEVASYADGILSVKIAYSEHPELLDGPDAKRIFARSGAADVPAAILQPEHFKDLVGKWRMISSETEGDIYDAKTAGIDCTLEIFKDGTAHYIYNQGDKHDDCGFMRVKVENKAMCDGPMPQWSASLLGGAPEQEFYVTVMPDGKLRLMLFSYMKDKEYPAVMMGNFKRL